MPNWFTLSLADLNDHKVGELIDALRTEALASGQSDPMPRIMVEITNELRGAIAFSGRYQIDATTTALPNTLKETAVKKVIRVMKSRLELGYTKAEEEDSAIYEQRLKALIEYRWPVDEPDVPLVPVTTQQVSALPSITPRVRSFTRDDADGI
jgi:hypothetical protein